MGYCLNEEIKSLHKNQTFELVKLPLKKRIGGCKWVYKRKEGTLRVEDIKYKTHLVEKGYGKKEGMDFNEVFSLVVQHSSIRMLFAMVAMLDLEVEQLNVKMDFQYGELEE